MFVIVPTHCGNFLWHAILPTLAFMHSSTLPPLFGMTCLLQLGEVTFKNLNIKFLFLPQYNFLPSDTLCVWPPTGAPITPRQSCWASPVLMEQRTGGFTALLMRYRFSISHTSTRKLIACIPVGKLFLPR